MKSILLHVFEDSGFEGRLAGVLDLARTFEGHITCLHATPLEDYLVADPFVVTMLPLDFESRMAQQREKLQERVEDRLRSEGASWDWVHRNEPMSAALIHYSILSDLVVLTLAGRAVERDEPRPLVGEVATRTRVPVLAIPEQSTPLKLDSPIVIAWNGSPEAAAAARAALPLLKQSRRVILLQVADKQAPYPRDLIARYLSHHDVHVEIVQRGKIEDRVGLTILEVAAEFEAGLVVMGAYGHSRLQEFLLGGVTRALIHNSPLPLLLAH